MADRYEINHSGEIVVGESALCADQTKMLQDLFSQYGWSCTEEGKEGSCHKLRLEHSSCDSRTINVYSGTIRNESRNAYEKKIQLGTASDPRKKSKKDTIILGIYVFNANDTFKDAIFVGYPVDERINYDTNPSIRGTESPKPYLLIIEEINRANVAAVFGDIFQLLDRDSQKVSEYPIQASEDIKKYLAKELGGEPDNYAKIKIPNNMFIWATMNSADQGVFPMDTAFKRRWDFTYIGINDNDADLNGKTVEVGSKVAQRVEWNKLRKAINDFLAKQKINEDKQLGPYFISRDIVVPEGSEIDKKRFAEVFKSKVIMYLFEDAAKQKRATLFEGCFQNSSRYSEICKEFDEHGIGIFNHDIVLAADPEDTAGPLAGTMPENE